MSTEDAESGSFISISSASAAMETLKRLRANTRTWRASQDPKALLTADARGILGKHFDRFGPAVIQLVTAAGEPRAGSE